jgi:hypothetical protein
MGFLTKLRQAEEIQMLPIHKNFLEETLSLCFDPFSANLQLPTPNPYYNALSTPNLSGKINTNDRLLPEQPIANMHKDIL